MEDWSVEWLGDAALLLRASASGRGEPARAAERMLASGIGWIADAVPAYDTVAVHLDRSWLANGGDGTPPERLVEAIRAALRGGGQERAKPRAVVEIPVVYGGEHGPDLAEAAARSGLSAERFAREHAGAEYEVAMLGFAPGFPYLTGLPEHLAQPRRQTPRARVESGAVGIAGAQTGVYPVASPGGWQIVGRTPMRLFRPEAEEPFSLRPGDRVRFVPIPAEKADWNRASGADVAAGGAAEVTPEAPAALAVLAPGLATTVQDLGRPGWQAFGVSAGGAMDADAFRLANRLVGNDEAAAALEITLQGGVYRIKRDVLAAVAGAELEASVDGDSLPQGRPVLLRAGAMLVLGRALRGCRAYLAIAGGIDVPPALGSRSTDARAGIGGYRGRALAAGDALRACEPPPAARRLMAALAERAAESGALWAAPQSFAAAASSLPREGRPAVLRALPGVGWRRFARQAQQALEAGEYAVLPASDRMGLRLSGAPLPAEERGELLSHGVAPGAVQVPADGQPIVLAAGCQPTGGYPVIAHVISADRGLLAQLKPGDRLRFALVDLEQAWQALRERGRNAGVQAAAIRLRWFR